MVSCTFFMLPFLHSIFAAPLTIFISSINFSSSAVMVWAVYFILNCLSSSLKLNHLVGIEASLVFFFRYVFFFVSSVLAGILARWFDVAYACSSTGKRKQPNK